MNDATILGQSRTPNNACGGGLGVAPSAYTIIIAFELILGLYCVINSIFFTIFKNLFIVKWGKKQTIYTNLKTFGTILQIRTKFDFLGKF